MTKIVSFIILVFLFGGCSNTVAHPKKSLAAVKVFENEDALIMYALRAEQLRDYSSSSKIFNTLYEKSNKKEYLYNSLQSKLKMFDSQAVIDKVDEITKGSLDDYYLVRIKIVALLQQEKLEEAKNLALKLVDKSNAVDDYLLVSEIYVKQKKYNTAVKYLESAYTQDYNEKILDKMSIVLYVNLQRRKDAIAQLETHSRVYGCSELICNRLLGFYSNDNNIDGLLSTYLRLYKIKSSKDIARKIVQLYAYKKEYIKLMSFLENSKSDDDTLLQLYVTTQNYVKAYPLADKLYAKTGEVEYLGKSAIYEYESSSNRNDKELLDRVVNKLGRVVRQYDSPLYLNYYGYILIDHDIDVKKGMKYVNKALESEPNSPYYLDSLAWGYYKLGECEKASEIIDKVSKMEGGDVAEVIEHVKIINQCKIKDKKGKIRE